MLLAVMFATLASSGNSIVKQVQIDSQSIFIIINQDKARCFYAALALRTLGASLAPWKGYERNMTINGRIAPKEERILDFIGGIVLRSLNLASFQPIPDAFQ
jgi:hypothetical protein